MRNPEGFGAVPEPPTVPPVPESVAERDEPDVMEDLKLSSESESSDIADSQYLPTDVDDDMESAEEERMKILAPQLQSHKILTWKPHVREVELMNYLQS